MQSTDNFDEKVVLDRISQNREKLMKELRRHLENCQTTLEYLSRLDVDRGPRHDTSKE